MAELITEDVPRFWQAFERVLEMDAEEVMERVYLDAGTAGVTAFTPERIISATHLVQAVRSRHTYYRSICDCCLRVITDLRPRLESTLERFSTLLPGTPERDVYFVIGAMNSGGTLSRGLEGSFAVIGLEFFSAGSHALTQELNDWEKSVIQEPDILPAIVAHELIHTLQEPPANAPHSLLLHTLAEGAAEYLGEVVCGQVINPALQRYGLAHEAELKRDFARDLKAGAGSEEWLYQGDKAKDKPADLGYFIGAQIMRAYHERYRHKPNVIRDLLQFSLRQPEDFLRRSGYLAL